MAAIRMDKMPTTMWKPEGLNYFLFPGCVYLEVS